MKNHNFENKIIQSFLEEDLAPIAKKPRKNSSKMKTKVYLTLISLAIGAFGVILIIRGLFLFNPLTFHVSDTSYNIGLNKPLGFKSINVDLADFPSSYPKNLENPHNPDGVYFVATTPSNSLLGFLDPDEKLHKTVWVTGEVSKFIPLEGGNYYLAAVKTASDQYIDLVSYEGINFRVKDLTMGSLVQDLYYDENEDIFIFGYIDEDGLYNLEGLTTNNKSFNFYSGSIDEGTTVVNYTSDRFYLSGKKQCQELNLENKNLVSIDCKAIKLPSSETTILFTTQAGADTTVNTFDQLNGTQKELVKISSLSAFRKQANKLLVYSNEGLFEGNLLEGSLNKIDDKFSNYVFDDIFSLGKEIYFKSRITNSLYKYAKNDEQEPISYVSYPVSDKLELKRTIDGLDLNNFEDFTVYLPDNIYTL